MQRLETRGQHSGPHLCEWHTATLGDSLLYPRRESTVCFRCIPRKYRAHQEAFHKNLWSARVSSTQNRGPRTKSEASLVT